MNSPIRTVVIGVGHLGYHHARIHASTEGVHLVGVVDTDAEKRARAEQDFGVRGFDSVEQLLAEVFSAQEDIANVRLRFASGCVANLTASRVSLEKMRKIRIFEANAYVSTDYSAQEVVVYRKKPGTPPPDANPMEQIEIEPLEVQKEEPLRAEITHFIDCVRAGSTPAVSAEDGIRALDLAEQITAFIRSHA